MLLVFDVTREDSLENLGNWISEVSKILDNLKDLPLIVAGNKIDLRDAVDTSVSKEDAVKYIKEITSSVDLDFVSYVETSAKTGENIDEIFSKLVNSILNKNK